MTENSHDAGLIHALQLDGAGGCVDLDWPTRDKVDDKTQPGRWLHFDFEDPSAMRWLAEESGLNDIAVSALLAEDTRPRAINRGDNLLLALRGLNFNPGEEPDDMVSLRIWTDGASLVSTRRRKLLATQDILENLADNRGPKNPAELIVTWIDRIVQRMNETVEGFEDQVLELEERILEGEVRGIRLDLAHLRRSCISIRRYLAPQREAMNRLCSEPLSWIGELDRLRLREINDRLIRHIENIDEVRERAAMAQEELLSRVSEQMNERTYLFTIVAALFLPLGFFTGLMGINVGGMPGVENDAGFWAVAAMSAGIAVSVAIFLKIKRWF